MNTVLKKKPIKKNTTSDIYPHQGFISRTHRNQHIGHSSGVIWLTGLSGAGKSTIANAVEKILFEEGFLISILDGDTLRSGLNQDLGFTTEEREENLRRTGEVASLFANTGHIVLASFISPHHKGRETVRQIIGKNFHLVHVYAEVDDCIKRDPKGLYQKALLGGIKNFTGISQTFEDPSSPDLLINTSTKNIAECTIELASFIKSKFKY